MVTLTNTSTADVLVPSDVLTAVFFSIPGAPALTPYYATLGTGSRVLFAPAGGAGPDVGGEWAYRGGLTGAPGGANQGISSTGLGLFGPGDRFPGANLQGPDDPDGVQYGITSAGDNPLTGNTAVTGSNALIQNSVVFELGSATPGGGFNLSDISNVSFQYGTALAVPEPGTLVLLGSGLVILGLWGRKRLSKRLLGTAIVLAGALFAAHAYAISVTASNFDQLAQISALGGTATFVGSPPPVTATTGVSVTLPGWVFPSLDDPFASGGSSEPGNVVANLFGRPTDLTFTAPGAGGPDGGPGDGSVQLLTGGFVTLRFPHPITAPAGVTNDLFIFTDTAGGGRAFIEILGPSDVAIPGESLTTVIPGGNAGTGMGGLILNLADGTVYSAVRLTVLQNPNGSTGSVEIDAVGAFAPVPEPSTLLLFGSGVVGLGMILTRRRNTPK